MDYLLGIFSAFGLSTSAGLNAYIPLLAVALTARFTDLFTLAEPWNVLESWWVIGLLVVLSVVEFFADKIPAINHVNDVIQTFIRPTAGAIVFAASARVITDVHPVLALSMGLLVAGGVHAVKSAAVRPAVTAATGGAGNIPVSIAEDVLAFFLSVLATILPVLLAVVLVIAGAWLAAWGARRISRKPVH
jgi:hypothetical protein